MIIDYCEPSAVNVKARGHRHNATTLLLPMLCNVDGKKVGMKSMTDHTLFTADRKGYNDFY